MLSAARAKLDASTTRTNILIEYSRSIPFLDNGFNRNPQRSPTMPISIGSGVLVQLYGSHLVKSAVNPDDSMPTPDFRKPEKSSYDRASFQTVDRRAAAALLAVRSSTRA
jgi:hypothetical protein